MARTVRKTLTPEEAKKRRLLQIFGIVGGLIAIVLIILLVSYLRITGEPPLPPDATIGVDSGAVSARTTQNLRAVEQAVRSGRQMQINMQLTNADINQLINSAGGGGGPVQNLECYIGRDRIIGRGRVDWEGRSLNMQVALRLSASNGALSADVDEVWVGSMKAPDSVRQKLQEQLSRQLQQHSPQQLGIHVESITLQPGKATVTGYTTGRR